MATNDTNDPKVPRQVEVESETNRRGVYVSDSTWKRAKVFAAEHEISISRLFEESVLEKISKKSNEPPAKDEVSVRSVRHLLFKNTNVA